jgi:hypothetical protein
MRWMLNGAIEAGLKMRAERYRKRYTLTEAAASGRIHSNGLLWKLAGRRRRPIPENARIHGSVQTRIGAVKYRPNLPRAYTWEDEHWWGTTAIPPTRT